MIYIDWRKGKAADTLEVDILCSKCKKVHTTIIDRISKLTMSICPHCNNVDVERTAGKIPANVEKQLNDLVSKNLIYTIDGMDADDFLTGLAFAEIDSEEFSQFKEFNLAKSYSGLYRLKSYYSQAKAKGQVNMTDFPTFEDFMLWSVKQGYRDWKTLKLDKQNNVSKQAVWIPGGYSKKNTDLSLAVTTDLMVSLAEMKDKLVAITQTISNNTKSNADLNFIYKTIAPLLQSINATEAEIMTRL